MTTEPVTCGICGADLGPLLQCRIELDGGAGMTLYRDEGAERVVVGDGSQKVFITNRYGEVIHDCKATAVADDETFDRILDTPTAVWVE